jgi:DNA-binding transcriptional ArsR family regulator
VVDSDSPAAVVEPKLVMAQALPPAPAITRGPVRDVTAYTRLMSGMRTLRHLPNHCASVDGVPTAEAEQLDRAFHALADESRRSIVVRLSRGPASVSELAAPLEMSLPSVLQHLDVLQRSGLVRSEKVGRVRTCRLEPGPMRTLESWIAEHRAIWERRFDRLADVLDDVFGTDEGEPSR